MRIRHQIAISLLMAQLLTGIASADGSFSVNTVAPVYSSGELVEVVGTVPFTQTGFDVAILVHKPGGALWAIAQSSPAQNNTFRATVARLSSSDPTGTYTVTAKYNGSSVSTRFNVTLASVQTVVAGGQTFTVSIKSMSGVTGFNFSQSLKSISFTVDPYGDYAYIVLPDALLSGNVTLLVNDATAPTIKYPINGTHTAYWVSYHAPARIVIIGTRVIPEFPGWVAFAMLTTVSIVSLVAMGLRRRRLLPAKPFGC